jgi:hypothetical protein
MECEALVPTSDISKIKIGQTVLLHIEGLAEEFIGNVTRINPATQAGSRSIAIYIQVANPRINLNRFRFCFWTSDSCSHISHRFCI